jgi:hypothetical protein
MKIQTKLFISLIYFAFTNFMFYIVAKSNCVSKMRLIVYAQSSYPLIRQLKIFKIYVLMQIKIIGNCKLFIYITKFI